MVTITIAEALMLLSDKEKMLKKIQNKKEHSYKESILKNEILIIKNALKKTSKETFVTVSSERISLYKVNEIITDLIFKKMYKNTNVSSDLINKLMAIVNTANFENNVEIPNIDIKDTKMYVIIKNAKDTEKKVFCIGKVYTGDNL